MPREPGTGRATNEPVGRTQVTWPGEGTEAPGPGEEAQGHPQLGLEERREPRVPWATLPRNPRIEGASPPKPQETEGIQAPRRGQCEKQIHVTELCRGHWAFVWICTMLVPWPEVRMGSDRFSHREPLLTTDPG